MLLIFFCTFVLPITCRHSFSFPVYTYKRKHNNEQVYHQEETKCTSHCDNSDKDITTLERTKCIRLCLSDSCYSALYSFNELEEGEIDVRFTSFKGCVLQDLKSKGYRVI